MVVISTDGIGNDLAAVNVESLVINQADQMTRQNVMLQLDVYAFRKQQEIQRNSVLALLGIGGSVNALA
jgi:hypothetical protein